MNDRYNSPWRIVRDSEYTGDLEDTKISGIQDCKGQTVLFTDSGYFEPKEDYAKLIEAAPQLLEFAQIIASADWACNCADQHSWYGEGHASECPQGMAQELIKAATE